MTSTAPPAAFAWTRRHVIALAVLCLAALLDTIDVTVVNVAMPTIQTALHFSEGGLAWMVNAYMVPFGGFLLLAGRAGDLLGRRLLTNLIGPEVIVGLGAGLVLIPTSVAAMSGVPAERGGIASALLNVSRQLGGALGLAVISTVVTTQAARALVADHAAAAALTAGFRDGFAVSAGLMIATVITALLFLREDGRGASVNLVELQVAGAS